MGVDAKPQCPESNQSNQSNQSTQANVKGPRLNRRVAIAVPALAAIATAAVLSSQALSSSPVADVKPAPLKAAAANLAVTASPSAKAALAKAASDVRASMAKTAKTQLDRRTVSATQWYTVRSGDTLSGIAGRFYHQTSAWPVIYYANRGKVSSADVISPGEVLRVPAKPAHI
ncbi:MAG TPA: LysM peptidoglycan-binding domain-containing protein, partial [Streptosporangiaceae bacterium]|nr:LysM peptidoglycan-binding domain-containing protein [Streptosporangiaceae bacterium]